MLQVTSVVPTAAGRLLFARLEDAEPRRRPRRRTTGLRPDCRGGDLGDRRRGRWRDALRRREAVRTPRRCAASSTARSGRAEACDGVVVVLPAGREWPPPAGVRVTTPAAQPVPPRSGPGWRSFPPTPTWSSCTTRRARSRRAALFARVVDAVARWRRRRDPGVAARRHGEARDATTASSRPCRATTWSQCRRRRRFARGAFRAAHASEGVGTDDAALVEAAGGIGRDRRTGEPRNVKLTLSDDLELRAGAHRRSAGVTRHRVGLGFDVHPFGDDAAARARRRAHRRSPPLAGHSDGDAVAHAVADALLGPAGLPDLGTLYPATDEQYRGADSMAMLAEVVRTGRARRLVGRERRRRDRRRAPQLAPHVDAMAANRRDVLAPAAGTDGRAGRGVDPAQARRRARCDRPRRRDRGVGRRIARR